MDEEQPEEEKKDLASRISRFFPAVSKPDYKQGLNSKLKWTGIALLLFLLLDSFQYFNLTFNLLYFCRLADQPKHLMFVWPHFPPRFQDRPYLP